MQWDPQMVYGVIHRSPFLLFRFPSWRVNPLRPWHSDGKHPISVFLARFQPVSRAQSTSTGPFPDQRRFGTTNFCNSRFQDPFKKFNVLVYIFHLQLKTKLFHKSYQSQGLTYFKLEVGLTFSIDKLEIYSYIVCFVMNRPACVAGSKHFCSSSHYMAYKNRDIKTSWMFCYRTKNNLSGFRFAASQRESHLRTELYSMALPGRDCLLSRKVRREQTLNNYNQSWLHCPRHLFSVIRTITF